MTTTIEPTEEQCEAVFRFLAKEIDDHDEVRAEALARLLAEREAALLALVQHAHMSSMARAADLDAARARIADLEKSDALLGRHADLVEQIEAREAAQIQRIAELESDVAGKDELVESLRYDVAKLEATESAFAETDAALRRREAAHLQRIVELEAVFAASTSARVADTMANLEREAAHLAHIKALRACCHGLVHDVDRLMCGIDVGRHAMLMRSTLADAAHYDVEGGEG